MFIYFYNKNKLASPWWKNVLRETKDTENRTYMVLIRNTLCIIVSWYVILETFDRATFVGVVYGCATSLSSSIVVAMASHALNNLIGGVSWRLSSESD